MEVKCLFLSLCVGNSNHVETPIDKLLEPIESTLHVIYHILYRYDLLFIFYVIISWGNMVNDAKVACGYRGQYRQQKRSNKVYRCVQSFNIEI